MAYVGFYKFSATIVRSNIVQIEATSYLKRNSTAGLAILDTAVSIHTGLSAVHFSR